MKKRNYLKYGHQFDNGGWRNNWGTVDEHGAFTSNFANKGLGTTLGMTSSAASILGTAYGMATPNTDTMLESVDNEIEALKQSQQGTQANSLDDLMSQWSGFRTLEADFDKDNYYVGPSGGDIFKNTLSSAVSGATAGAAAGPWGAVIGGIVGLGSGLAGGLIGKNKAEDAAEEAIAIKTKAINDLNTFKQASFNTQAQNLTTQNNRILATQAAYGGPLGISLVPVGSAIGYMQNEELLSSLGENMTKNNNRRISMPTFAFGGALSGYGGDWSNGLNFVKSGNTHEQNPLGGVPMGMAEDGTPNLVEEGEVIWNDYVFSNRIKVPEKVRSKYKLKGKDNMTFAEAVEKAQKASAERPNDPIEQRTLNTLLTNLIQEQESIREKKAERANKKAVFAYGGPLGMVFEGEGDRPYYIWGTTAKGDFTQGYNLLFPNNTDDTRLTDVENAPLMPVTTTPTSYGPEDIGSGINKPAKPLGPYDPNNAKVDNSNKEGSTAKGTKSWETWLRYAPVLGTSIGLGYTLLNRPTYKYSNELDAAAKDFAGSTPHVSYNPIGNYLAYTPFDRLFYANELGAQQAATRRGILNLSNGNRGAALAGLLASDYSGNVGLGKLYREGDEYNLAQRQKVAEFNRGTNMFNSEADLKAQMTNAEIDRARAGALLDAKIKSLGLKQAEDQAWDASLAANLTGLFDNIGNIGWEAVNRNMINSNLGQYYGIRGNGTLYYKGGMNTEQKKAAESLGLPTSKKNGGYLTIKNRRRRNA